MSVLQKITSLAAIDTTATAVQFKNVATGQYVGLPVELPSSLIAVGAPYSPPWAFYQATGAAPDNFEIKRGGGGIPQNNWTNYDSRVETTSGVVFNSAFRAPNPTAPVAPHAWFVDPVGDGSFRLRTIGYDELGRPRDEVLEHIPDPEQVATRLAATGNRHQQWELWADKVKPVPTPTVGLHFDGTNDRVLVTAPHVSKMPSSQWPFQFERNQAFTIEAWLRPDALRESAIITKVWHYQKNGGYELFMTAEGYFGLRMMTNVLDLTTDCLTVNSDVPLTLNKWQHVAVTYDGSGQTWGIGLYLDGKRQNYVTATALASLSATALIASNGPLNLGGRTNPGSQTKLPYKGAMDEVRVWRGARRPEDIAGAMSRHLATSETGDLVLSYAFEDGKAGADNTALKTVANGASTAGTSGTFAGNLVSFALTGATSNFVEGPPILP